MEFPPPKILRFCNLTATLTAYIFDNQEVRWQLDGVSYITSKQHELTYGSPAEEKSGSTPKIGTKNLYTSLRFLDDFED